MNDKVGGLLDVKRKLCVVTYSEGGLRKWKKSNWVDIGAINRKSDELITHLVEEL